MIDEMMSFLERMMPSGGNLCHLYRFLVLPGQVHFVAIQQIVIANMSLLMTINGSFYPN